MPIVLAAALGSILLMAAAGKDNKKPAPGVQDPGVQIPFRLLKAEAEIQLEAAPTGAVFQQQALVAAGDAILRVDPKTNKPGEPIQGVGRACAGVINAHGHLWTSDCAANRLVKMNAKDSKIAAALTAEEAVSLAATADSIWLLSGTKTDLLRVDPESNTVVASVRLPQACSAILAAESALWVACPSANRVLRIDPATNLIDKHIAVEGQPSALTAGEGSVWVHLAKEGKVAQLDPKSNKVSNTIALGVPDAGASMAFGDGSVWVSLPGFPLTRIHAASAKVVQQFHGTGGAAVFHGLNAVWLLDAQRRTVTRFDPKRIAATLAE